MNDILLIRNDVEFSGKHKGVFERSFSKKDLGEAAYILSIKIYRDRSRRLINFFNEYIPWQVFEVVQNVDYNEIFWTVAMLKSVRIMLAIATFYEIWQMDVKTAFLMDLLKKSCIWCNQKVLSILKVLTKCASSSDPSMDWCKHLGVGIYALMR